jgi:hypothetical protein
MTYLVPGTEYDILAQFCALFCHFWRNSRRTGAL